MARSKIAQTPFTTSKSPATGTGGQQTSIPPTSGGPSNAIPRLGMKGLGKQPK